MKSKIKMAAIGLVTGTLVFSTTAFVALANNSNYDTYKKGIFKLIESNNYTFEFDGAYKFKDGTYYEYKQKEMINKDKRFSENTDIINGEEISNYSYYNGPDSYIAYKDNEITSQSTTSYSYDYEPLKATEAQKKLFEIAVDLFVGDLKNNLISDGKTVSIELTEHQIPQIAHAFFDVMREAAETEMEFDYDGDDPSQQMVTKMMKLINTPSAKLKSASFEGEFDAEGYVTKGIIKFSIVTDTDSLDFTLDGKAYDIGNTVVNVPKTAE